MTGRLFIFGFGYTATFLAEALEADGWAVSGVTRSAERAERLRARGFDVAPLGLETPLASDMPAIRDATHLLGSAPPGADGDPALIALGPSIGRLRLSWIGYFSTTGVYGDRGGAAVDEASDLRPTSPRSERRVVAEGAWRALNPAAHVFRLPGIYGPGRNGMQQIVDGRARRILKPGHLSSRVHVADIVQTVRASMARPRPGAIYNVTDDLPAEPAAVLAYAAELLGRPPPPAAPFETAELSPMARRILKPGHLSSRIRVADIVQTVRASMARPRPGAIYNVTDDLPAEPAAVLAYAAELLGRPPPPAASFETAALSPMARSFYRDDKTVSNDLIKRELGVVLRYPTYREGLAALAADYSAG